MLFPSEEFLLIFLPVVLVGYYAIHILTYAKHDLKLKNIWLLISSIVFYAWGEPVYVFLMVGYIIFNYLMALLIDSHMAIKAPTRRLLFVLTIVVNIAALVWFKYARAIFSGTALSVFTEGIVLPIGISFYTFQAMSYVADVYNGRIKAEKNPLYVGLYVAFFPQLIAGPIVRYETIADRLRSRREDAESFCRGAERFAIGMIKKVLIANRMAAVADNVWGLLIDGQLQTSVSLAWLGAISYTLQIFFDFSGYSDMAVGLGGMFGFKLPENFDHPYTARSITEFWRKWHMTLSGWFRDYVYIPLGGSREGKVRLVRNLFVVWLLTGIWHGDSLTFVVWGMLYFVCLVTEKLAGANAAEAGKSKNKGSEILTNIVKRIYTLLTVMLAWVIFRSDNMSDAMAYIKGMIPGIGGMGIDSQAALAYLKQNAVYYITAVILCMPVRRALEGYMAKRTIPVKRVYEILYGVLISAGFLLSVTFIYNNSYNPFIYFNF